MSLVGTTIGRIRIVDTLGLGGMGEVYLGYDEKLKRKVALKAIRDDQRLDAEAKARFLREALVLSQLDHPGICQIYELIEGEDSDFLVLELISGTSLRKAAEGLSDRDKLFVAERVAEALAVAHAKGVAHRDLKPENVMLTDDGRVKVLDFGLAFPVDERLASSMKLDVAPVSGDAGPSGCPDKVPSADVTATLLASPAGSPAVDSPPVREPRPVTTAISPSAMDTLRPPASSGTAGFVETERGAVMGTVAYMSPEQAQGKRVTVASDMYSFGLLLQELFTGRHPYEPGLELLEMFTKAAEGETLPVEGVETDLAALVDRLKSLAPEARPTAVEAAERLRWIQEKPRRRLRRLAVAAVAAALVLGGLKYTFDLDRERRVAVGARGAAEEARLEAEEISSFLLGLFAVSDPEKALGSTVTARELLDAGAAKIREDLGERPRSRSQLMFTIGRAYRKLGLYDRALPLLEEALEIRRRLGDETAGTAPYLDQLASLYHDLGDYEKAEPLLREALEIAEATWGSRHREVAASLNNLASHYRARGQDQRAEGLFLRALEIQRDVLGDTHQDVAKAMNSLGEVNRALGRYERAETYLRRAIGIQEEVLGAGHPTLARSLNNLAIVYYEQGETERAEPLYVRTLEIAEKTLGAEHPDIASVLNNLAKLYQASGEPARAEPLYRRALEIQEKALGKDHPSVAATLSNQADLYSENGDDERAEPLYRRALAIEERVFGPDHPDLAMVLADLASTTAGLDRYEEAEKLFLRALASAEHALAESASDPHRNRLAAVLVGLGKLYRATGSADRAAESWARAAAVLQPVTVGSEVAAYLHTHALALLYAGRIEEARPLAVKLLAKGWRRPEFLELCRRHGLREDG